MRNHTKSNDAVSPVVGVMLMLVVTIIIAAVVSAFAGGLGNSQKTTPQLTIAGTYSQTNGMTITHTGGDSVALSSVNFMTTPSEMMGTDAGKFAWIINNTIILDPANSNYAVYNITGSYFNTTSFNAGDTLVINSTRSSDYSTTTAWSKDTNNPPGINANARILWTKDDAGGKDRYFAAYSFGNPKNIGKYFYLDLVDTTGSKIARTKVTITK
ncbi:MAG TPA: type IV pilin N-terminal domain-containing protein [Methanoregula sp.]|nr:type IV pilin N-terminal domain-containing protein [Methanoregula sp.]